MSWRDDFKRWNNRSLKEVVCPHYVFNKWIFIVCMALVVLTGLFIMNNHDWDFSNKFYFHCPENGPICMNPFYYSPLDTFDTSYKIDCPVDDDLFCNAYSFMPGYTYGEQKSKDVAMFPLFSVSLFLFGLVLNHILFNKNKGDKIGK